MHGFNVGRVVHAARDAAVRHLPSMHPLLTSVPAHPLARPQVLHSSVHPSQLFYALNGAVVGLCAQPPAAPPQQQAAEPPALPCLGLGVVRAADAAARRLYLLTALSAEELEQVAVLQLGKLELPASLLQTARAMCPYLALHSLSSVGTGAGAIKSRNNLVRASQL